MNLLLHYWVLLLLMMKQSSFIKCYSILSEGFWIDSLDVNMNIVEEDIYAFDLRLSFWVFDFPIRCYNQVNVLKGLCYQIYCIKLHAGSYAWCWISRMLPTLSLEMKYDGVTMCNLRSICWCMELLCILSKERFPKWILRRYFV